MRTLSFSLVIYILFNVFPVSGQTLNTISGQILDGDQKPVEFASLNLLAVKDSSLVASAVSDLSGKYLFKNVAAGEYVIKVACMAYNRQSKPVVINSAPVTINFVLTSSVKLLSGVTISGRRPLIEAKSDRLVFNVSNTVLASGFNAMELLEKAPGIYINPQTEAIKLNGKQGTTIMVDGKKTYLAGTDLASLLKSFQSNTIDKIEIISNPGAKYDAQGGGGVINIVTKKTTANGTTGSVNVSGAIGQSKRTNGGFTLNHKSGNLIIYGGYNFSYRNSRTLEQMELDYLNPLNGAVTNVHASDNYSPYRSYSHSYRVGLDLNSSPKTIFSVLFTGFNYIKSLHSYSNTSIYQSNQVLDSILQNNTYTKTNNHQYAGNFTYKHTIDSVRVISAEFNYSNYYAQQHNDISNTYTVPNNTAILDGLTLRNSLPAKINIWVGKADYETPFLKGKAEFGAKYSLVNTNNDANYEVFDNNQWTKDLSRSNLFKYKEGITAGYFIYGDSLAGVEYKAGLRGELTSSKGNLVTTQQRSDRQYFDLFPSLALSKTIGKVNTFSLSYSRKINRPSYQDLNPFIYFIDIYTYSQGNPFLKPEYTNNFDLTYTLNSKYVVSVGYSVTSDVITYITERTVADSRITSITSKNINHLYQYYLNLTVPVNPAKWWTIYNSVSVSHLDYEKNEASPVNNAGFSGTYGISNYITLPHQWSPSVSGYFQSSTPNGIAFYKPQYQVSLGLQKGFKSGITVRSTYNDIFKSSRAKSVAYLPSLRTLDVYRWDSNFFQVSVSYPFGKKKIKPSNTNSAGNEQNRIK